MESYKNCHKKHLCRSLKLSSIVLQEISTTVAILKELNNEWKMFEDIFTFCVDILWAYLASELDATTSVGIKPYQSVYNITMFIYLSSCHISFETDIASKESRRERGGLVQLLVISQKQETIGTRSQQRPGSVTALLNRCPKINQRVSILSVSSPFCNNSQLSTRVIQCWQWCTIVHWNLLSLLKTL